MKVSLQEIIQQLERASPLRAIVFQSLIVFASMRALLLYLIHSYIHSCLLGLS